MKYQGFKVKVKPFLWQFLPWFSSYTAQAIYPYIFVSKKVFENLQSKNPNPRFIATLEHEKRHLEREKEVGFLKFGLKYLFSPKFRFQEELIADKEAMKLLKKRGLPFNIEKGAKYLSSWLYLWAVSEEKAKKELTELWETTASNL